MARRQSTAGRDDLFVRTARNRRTAADLLASLDAAQWDQQSLCAGWSVRVLAGHLIQPMEVPFLRAVPTIVAHGFSPDRGVDAISRRLAARPTEQIVATLRAKADHRVRLPGIGAWGPFTDSAVHLRDAARPLGLDATLPLDDWRLVLGFLTSDAARLGFVPRGRLDGLLLRAEDQKWAVGSGAEVTGPSEALALAVTGRRAALVDLDGPGVAVLEGRLH